MNLGIIKQFLEQNTVLFILLFFLSLIANLFEIRGYFREKKDRIEEQKRREEEKEQLRVYEYLFENAKEKIGNEEQLELLRDEISEKEGLIPTLESRIEALRLAAKREIVEQNVSRLTSDIRSSRDQLDKLLAQHAELEELPNLPESERAKIEEAIGRNTHLPYELPKAVAFRSLLLVLIIMLLPSPADQLLIVFLLSMFLTTFFEVAGYSGEYGLKEWVFKHYRSIGFLSCFGSWYFLLNAIENMLGRPLDIFFGIMSRSIREGLSFNNHSFVMDYFLGRSHLLSHFFIVILVISIAWRHWRNIKPKVIDIISTHEAS